MHNLDIFLHLETYIHLQNFDPLPGLVVPILMIELFLFLNRLKIYFCHEFNFHTLSIYFYFYFGICYFYYNCILRRSTKYS